MIKKVFAVLAMLLIGGFITNSADGEEITFDFTATVTFSQNTSNLTGGVVPVPSVLTGSYTFDSNAVDQIPQTNTEGSYGWETPPNGIVVHAGSNVFQTDPNNMEFLIFVEDGGSSDAYTVQSLDNLLPLPVGTPVGPDDIISIDVFGAEDFIFGDGLPLTPPQPIATPVLQMRANMPNSITPLFWIKANVESITLRPPPTVESTIQDCKNFVAGLPTSSFQNSNMMSTLLNKLDALKGTGEGTKNKLINDILAKGNGCGTAPDNNDWIKDCAAQAQFQAAVQAILDLL